MAKKNFVDPSIAALTPEQMQALIASRWGDDQSLAANPDSYARLMARDADGFQLNPGGGEQIAPYGPDSYNGQNQDFTRDGTTFSRKRADGLFDAFDATGKYLGTSNDDNKFSGKDWATFAALVAGGYAATGGMAGGAAAGGTSAGAVDAAALGLDGVAAGGTTAGATTGGTLTGASMSNGAFLGEGVSSGVGAWDAAAIKSAAASGEIGTAASYAGQNLVNGTLGDTASSLTGGLSDANSVKNAVDTTKGGGGNGGSNDMNWLDVVNTGLAVYGTAAASNASSDATDAAKDVANSQLGLNKEALDWYKQVYEDQAPDRAAAAERANAISDAQLRGMNFAIDQAQELDQYNKGTFRPIEQQLATTATEYDTPERRESAANAATGQVASSYDLQREQAARDMIRAGVDPSTIQVLGASSQIDEARAKAGAANTARDNVESQGWSRMADVANMGRNIASQQATQQNIATTTGNSSTSNAVQGLNATTSGNNLMAQGYQNATQGNQVVGNLFTQAGNAQRQDDQMLLNGVGGITNYLGNRYGTSDPKVKKGTGRMADAAKALKQIEDTPVHDGWEYDESKGAPAGSGGQKMTGPMADDVRRVSGEASAPGGKVIDLVKQQGRMMAAIKQLAKDVRSLKQHEAKPEMEAA